MPKYCFIFFFLFVSAFNLFARERGGTVPDTVQIQEVVVIRNIPLSDESMTENYRSLFSSVDQINERLGGVSVMSRGAYSMEPVIGTFSGGQINVTIDGMKMFGACTDKMDPVTSYVEPVNLKGLELSRGTNGNINGSTVGGTYNMSLQTAEKSTFRLEGGTDYKSVSDGKIAYLLFNEGKARWAYRVSGTIRDFSSYKDGNGEIVPFSQYAKVNIHQSFLFTPAGGHNLVFDWLIDNASDVGYPALPMDVSHAKGRIYSVSYKPEGRLWKFDRFRAKVYVNRVYHQMDDSHRDSLFLVGNGSGAADSVYMRMDMPGWSRTLGAFAEGSINWFPRNRLTFKLESYRHWSKAEMTMFMNNLSTPGEPPMFTETWPENSRLVTGLFIQNTCNLPGKVLLSANVRIDYSRSKMLSEQGKQQFAALGYEVNRPYRNLVKSANINLWTGLGRNLEIKVGAGYGERLPTSSEQFGFYLYNAMDGYDYLGDPAISTEKSADVWASLGYSGQSLKISAEGSYSGISDYIFGQAEPDYEALNLYASGVKQFVNLSRATVVSANLQALWRPLAFLEFFNMVKYNRGELSGNQPMPLVPPLNGLFYVSLPGKNYSLQAEMKYAAAQKRINKGFGETASSAYLLFNLRANYSIPVLSGSTIHIHAGINNLQDKVYSSHLDWGVYNRPGRSFNLGLNFRY